MSHTSQHNGKRSRIDVILSLLIAVIKICCKWYFWNISIFAGTDKIRIRCLLIENCTAELTSARELIIVRLPFIHMMRPFIFLLVLFVLSCCSASNTFIFEEVASLNAPIVIQPLDISVNGFPGMVSISQLSSQMLIFCWYKLVTEPLVTSIYINTGFARYYVLANFSSTSTPVTMSTQSATKIIACNGDDLVSYTIANGAAIASFTVLGPVKKYGKHETKAC